MNLKSVALMPLPNPFRSVLSEFEKKARLARADAIHEETVTSALKESEARMNYQDLCLSIMVCTEWGCYERTDGLFFCPEHREA